MLLVNQSYLNTNESFETNEIHSSSNMDLSGNENGNEIKPSESTKDDQIILKAVEDHPYDLTYTCLLLPRFDLHSLTKDVETELKTILQQICISKGWTLEFLGVKPEYMEWIMRVPPTISTGYFMQVIREQTSQQIFTKFPNFKAVNSTGDFWALGYLIITGSQQHPVVVVQRYIQLTRQQQGDKPNV